MATNSALTAFSLDDFEARSGSATSIVRTITGLYLRENSDLVSRNVLLELALAAGISAPSAQTAISRLIDKQVLESSAASMLRVPDSAQAMFERGIRRIFTPRQMSETDQWCLVSYSLPETMRSLRHQIRKHFQQLGGGLVSAGLWIFPEYLREEVTAVLIALDARQQATLFTTSQPHFPISAHHSAQQWWDLARLGSLHEDFLDSTTDLDPKAQDPATAYRGYVVMVDAWRKLPYLDPGLPAYMLPAQWPGLASRDRFLTLSQAFRDTAGQFASSTLSR
ncbi:PaaX family transcriptional regulator C-terminal domain-containing protein [Arthrobacter sp. S41]|uniref:PaaX family transcriptional regulator n=1 Tax=Arthrobacter sp. S41 TaxID=2509721 RepID=UPI00103556CA|nr:PaaX family transcriptional regulator C-terminal domain-containing protein [Arthrobacter sp. S41]TAP25968.1 regulator [Arthrobacter sp. S41]